MSSSRNAVGITSAYIRDAQDVTLQRRRRLVFQEGLANHIPNGNERYLTSLLGAKECIEVSCPSIQDTPTVLRYETYHGESFDWDGSTFTITDLEEHSYSGIAPSITTAVPFPSDLTDVILGTSVTSIGELTFESCTSLTYIEIPNSVISIGDAAFLDCSSLSSIEIPNSVTSIGIAAFGVCTSLDLIEIPNSVTSIGDAAFIICSSLSSIEIPDSVTSIAYGTFSACSSLSYIKIPNSVTSIGAESFGGCSSLPSIEIPNSVESIGNGAFLGCSSLESIEIPDSIISIEERAFDECINLTNITLGNSVESIGINAFADCTSLESIIIPSSVTSIGEDAFTNSALATVYIRSGQLTGINVPGENVPFFGSIVETVARVTTVPTLDTTVLRYATSQGNSFVWNGATFTRNTNLSPHSYTGITPSTLSKVPNSADLVSITIGNLVTSIGTAAFIGCTSLTTITIPNSVTSIGTAAFGSCSSLETVILGNSVQTIGSIAFTRCTLLTSIRIPASVTSIGSSAFSNSGLETVYIADEQLGIDSPSENVDFYGATVETFIP